MRLRFPCLLYLVVDLLTASNTMKMNEIRRGDFARSRPAPSELKVFDWNIDRGRRFEKIAAGIAGERPDLALLQEVDLGARRSGSKDIAEELAKRLHLNFVFAPEFQELAQGSSDKPAFQGQAILTALPIRSSRMLRFATQSDFWQPRAYVPKWSLFQRRLGGRIALITELGFDQTMLVVYNLHLESRSGGRIQYEQLKEVLKDAARYPDKTPILIGGDINTKYPHSVTEVAALMREAGYRSAFGDRRERTHMIYGDLDWIFVRGPLTLDGAKVHKEIGGSDHYAISAHLAAGDHRASH